MKALKSLLDLNPRLLIPLTLLVVCWVNLNHARWLKYDCIHQDVNGYYSYLPALFYEKDLSLSFLNDTTNRVTEQRYYWPNKTPEGRYVIKYSLGMALCYLPFFTLAHIYCSLTGTVANGFTMPYHIAVQFSSLLYVLIGLYFLIRLLEQHFKRPVIWVTCICVLFGTNLLYYMTVWAGMPHATLFGLLAVFLYLSVDWFKHPSPFKAILWGLVFGIILLIRPIHLLLLLFVFLFGVSSWITFKEKITFLIRNKGTLFLFFLTAALVFIPQLLYWKYASGHYFFNAYLNERFFFLKPHVLDAVFGFRKGWLIYTPLMLFALLGLHSLRKKRTEYYFSTLVFFLVYIYVIFSWWCWWYGGSFGQRAMIDIYSLLAVPFAAFLEDMRSFNKPWRQLIQVVMLLLFLLNIFQTIQAKGNVIHYDSMTRRAYLDAFFRIKQSPEQEQWLKAPDYQKALEGQEESP